MEFNLFVYNNYGRDMLIYIILIFIYTICPLFNHVLFTFKPICRWTDNNCITPLFYNLKMIINSL